jgi:hypothetical protein
MKPLCVLSSLVLLFGAAIAQPNPVPLIYQPLIPMTVKPGSNQFTLTINGTGFVSGAVVTWNGSTRSTSFISSTQVQAQINAADVANPGTALVNVTNPTPGGGMSNTVFFPIQTPAPYAVLVQAPGFSGSGVSVAGDFNNDGLLDLAVANQNSGDFLIDTYIGKGDGTFNPPVANYSVVPVVSMITGNFNQDALLDLAALDGMANTTIFASQGSGIFTQQQVFRSPIPYCCQNPPYGNGWVTADFNGDGKLDLVVTGSQCTKIFLGNGDGTFGGGVSITQWGRGGNFGTPAVGDFNGDGKLDLALPAGDGSRSVTILLGNGDGTFQAPVSYNTAYEGFSAAVADVNGDGKLDIITNGVSVLLGNGDGTFTNGGGVPISNNQFLPSAPVLGDFNGDGKLDVAVSSGSTIYLLLGNGDGTFQNPTQVATDNATSLVMGDFNSDGKLDLVGTSLYLQIPINLSPASLGFSQNVGTQSPPQYVTVLNVGSSALPITGINIGGSDPNDFSQTNNCPASLPAGTNCQIAVVFQPQAPGPSSATLNVSYQGLGSPQTVSLSGTGTQPGALTLSPTSLNFGNQTVGITSPPQGSTLTNTGNGPVTITSIQVTGPNSGDFAQSNNCPASLSPNNSCQISVTFTPTATGTRNAAVTITDNAPNSPQSLPLTGVGVLPAVTFSPTSLTFPTQLIYTTSQPEPVQLTNSGLGILLITKISATGPFSETNNCPSSLNPNAYCTINVKFHPKTKGALNGSLNVKDNAPDSPQKVPLTGTGTYVQLVPAKVNFGTQPVGTKSLPKKITLTNKGDGPVNITSIAITGTDAGDFAETNNCGKQVKSGASCFIKVTFKPLAKGERTADTSVSDDGGGSPQTVPLSGTGT